MFLYNSICFFWYFPINKDLSILVAYPKAFPCKGFPVCGSIPLEISIIFFGSILSVLIAIMVDLLDFA